MINFNNFDANIVAGGFTSNLLPREIPTGSDLEYFITLQGNYIDGVTLSETRYSGTLNINMRRYGSHYPYILVSQDALLPAYVNAFNINAYVADNAGDYSVSGAIIIDTDGEISQITNLTDGINLFIANGIVGRSGSGIITLTTNIPICSNQTFIVRGFEGKTRPDQLVYSAWSQEMVQNIYNWQEGGESSEPYKWYTENTFATGNADYNGFTPTSANSVHNQDIFTDSENDKICYYYNASENSWNLLTTGVPINQVYYSDGNGYYDNGANPYYSKFYAEYDGQIGNNIIVASKFNTNIPCFATLSDAQDYQSGLKDVNDALNFGEISTSRNPANHTGSTELNTIFSDTYHTSIFGQQYACSVSALRDIANVIYSDESSIIENVKKGLEMYGENPIDSIIDLTYYPFDILSVVHNTVPQNYINFGSFRAELAHNLNRIVYSNGYVDAGSVEVKPTYKNWIDYAHTGLQVYLPYIGLKTLRPADYIGKIINVRYYFDFHSRGCTACLIANGTLLDYFNGQIGISQPINARDFASYAENTINYTVNTVAGLANPAGNIVSGLAKGAGGAGAVGLAINAGVAIDATMASAVYEYATNHATVESKGSVGSDTGGHMPQYVFFKFTYEDPIQPSNLTKVLGKPSNAGGTVGSFGGFLKCSTVHLECSGATAKERDEIKAQLLSGVYI